MVEEQSAQNMPGPGPVAQPATSTPGAGPAPAGPQPVSAGPAGPAKTPPPVKAAQPATESQPPTAGEPPTAAPPPTGNQPAGVDTPAVPPDPGFLERGGLRRRLRFLRKTRELAYRDLGGLVFELHRLGQERKDLLEGKLATLSRIDRELRAIEAALREHRGVTVLREAGVTACPRCAAIHGSEDRFCPACGFSMSRAERPIAANPNPVAAPVGSEAQGQTQAQPTTPPPTTMRPQPTTPPPTTMRPQPTTPPPTTMRPNPSPSPPPSPPTAVPSRPQAVPTQPVSAQPPPEVDEPTEIVEPPTQIVHPGDPPAEKSKRA
jgi:hypothetical protein